MTSPPERSDKEQSKAFIAKARELEADHDDSAADALMGTLAKMKPEPRQQNVPDVSEQVVKVGDVSVTVGVFQKMKRVWTASGVHFGQPLSVDGPTKEAAVAAWMTRASYLKP
jgi:hypothetical protein